MVKTKSKPSAIGFANDVVLDAATERLFEEGVPVKPGEHPFARVFKREFLKQRISEGMITEKAVIATRRRFATPDEPEARERILAARESLARAGVFGVAPEPGVWTVDKPGILAFSQLDHDTARDLIEDALDGFISFGNLDLPNKALDWWYLETPDYVMNRAHERELETNPEYVRIDRELDEETAAFERRDPEGFNDLKEFLAELRAQPVLGQWEWTVALNYHKHHGMDVASAIAKVRDMFRVEDEVSPPNAAGP